MDALSTAILRLLKRQDETDRRLEAIEAALSIARAPAPASVPPPPSPEVETPPPVPVESPPIAAATAASTPPPTPPQLETKVGLAWVNRIGAVTLALGVAFAFKYAVDNQWIGPAGRVALGVLAGLAALAAADRIWR